ncbi:MAG TPA: hypothetical protein VJB59_13075 [Bdellovibrionota bacterium]|nr:hypothetical protein [Bdellovibrionota bacterium]
MANMSLLQGEVAEEDQDRGNGDVERLLAGFLRALLDEQRPKKKAALPPAAPAAEESPS